MLSFIAAVWLASCGGQPPAPAGAGQMSSEQMLDMVDRIAARRAFHRLEIERATGRRLEPVSAESTPYFVVLKSAEQADATLRRVELREPAQGDRGMVILTVGIQPCIGQDVVRSRFGPRPEIVPPTPQMPVDAPVYLKYRTQWGVLSFGFPRSRPDCLTTVVLDSTER